MRSALLKATNRCGCICCRPHPLALKEPLYRQWRLSPVTDFLSLSTLSSLLRSFLCSLHLLCPSSAHHYLVSLLYFLFSSLSVPTALSRSTPSPVCCTCAGWSCRAEAEGVFVVNREAGEPTPDLRFMKKCGDLGTDLLLQRFSSCLFLFLASPGMLNVD